MTTAKTLTLGLLGEPSLSGTESLAREFLWCVGFPSKPVDVGSSFENSAAKEASPPGLTSSNPAFKTLCWLVDLMEPLLTKTGFKTAVRHHGGEWFAGLFRLRGSAPEKEMRQVESQNGHFSGEKDAKPWNRILPPGVYGDVAGLGIFVSPSLIGLVKKAIQDPLGVKLFKIAKKKGLVSITEAPQMLMENLPVDADHVRDALTGESRIRLADPSSPFSMVSLIHELVHCALGEKHNSQMEEWVAENVARRVHFRMTGDTCLKTITLDSIEALYSRLPKESQLRGNITTLFPELSTC